MIFDKGFTYRGLANGRSWGNRPQNKDLLPLEQPLQTKWPVAPPQTVHCGQASDIVLGKSNALETLVIGGNCVAL